jgi:hypothetical protein
MATGNQVLRAYSKAVKRIENDRSMSASQVSAGFIFSPKQKKGHKIGCQVFVKVCRYNDELLAREPDSGGLFCESKTMRQWERWNEIIEPLFESSDVVHLKDKDVPKNKGLIDFLRSHLSKGCK